MINNISTILEGKNTQIINKVKSIISQPEFKYKNSYDHHPFREQVLSWCELIAQEGIGSLAYPKKAGGSDDIRAYFAAMETLSYHDLSLVIKFGVQFGLWGMSVYLLGTEKHHLKYLPKIGSLELPGCFAMTETGHGSNVRGIQTTATYHHKSKSFIIHTPTKFDRKTYIGNAACHGKAATVFAKLIIKGVDYGVCGIIVRLRDEEGNTLEGITIEDCGLKMGLNGVDNGRIYFNQVKVPYDNLLDKFVQIDKNGNFKTSIPSEGKRFFTMLGTLVGGRIGIPKSALSAAKSGLTIAIKYANHRRQFGPKGKKENLILDYQSHQRRLMPLLAKAYALHFALDKLLEKYIDTPDDKMQKIEIKAAGLKAYTTWFNTKTLQECREACGGKGFLFENRISSLKNDSDIYTTFEGDNTVLMQLVAKGRLSQYKQQFMDIDFADVVNYIISESKVKLLELNPITTRDSSKKHLKDFEFYLEAFNFREKSILKSAANRIRYNLKKGVDSFETFNKCQSHLMNVGESYIERIILKEFIQKINTLKDGSSEKKTLSKLCQLFALSTIEKHKGWYLENDYLKGNKSKAIRKMVDELCKEVRKDAIELVEAFKIPDSCLAAPIAFDVMG